VAPLLTCSLPPLVHWLAGPSLTRLYIVLYTVPYTAKHTVTPQNTVSLKDHYRSLTCPAL